MARFGYMGVLFVVTFLWLGSVAYGFQFRVGGPRGWIKPTGNEKETYNEWASRNRFHIGDSLYFKYTNDSVLVVDRKDYTNCSTSSPAQNFTDGETTFTFDHDGFFYFISGKTDHCKSGQKLIVRVMVNRDYVPSGPAAAPQPGSGDADGGDPAAAPGKSSSEGIRVGSSFIMAVLGAVFVVSFFV